MFHNDSCRPGLRRRLRAETLEDRATPAVIGVYVWDRTVVITCDGGNDLITIYDTGVDRTQPWMTRDSLVIRANGQAAPVVSIPWAITNLTINTGGGNDTVVYTDVFGTTSGHPDQQVNINLGTGHDEATLNTAGVFGNTKGYHVRGEQGNDVIVANAHGAVQRDPATRLQGTMVLDLDGGSDNDRLDVWSTCFIGEGGNVSFDLKGGSGSDALRTEYNGEVDGVLSHTLNAGGGGADWVSSVAHPVQGSTGIVRWY